MMDGINDFGSGIYAVDSAFIRPRFDAVHVIVEDGRAAIIDTATNACVERVLAALHALGVAPSQVDYVCLTHIHLDHAGGAGRFMQLLPEARLTVHPRGARHMADPSRLWAGTVGVYGEAYVQRMYGEIVPVPAERIVETGDGAAVSLAGREIAFIDTPGHARHHVCIRDGATGRIFTGDTFGLSYPELTVDGRRSIFPTTTPVQFDPDAQHRSVERLLALGPEAVYVTHYGELRDVPRLAGELRRLIDAHAALGRREKDAGAGRAARLEAGVAQIVRDEARRQGWRFDRESLDEFFAADVRLNAQGIAAWLDGPTA